MVSSIETPTSSSHIARRTPQWPRRDRALLGALRPPLALELGEGAKGGDRACSAAWKEVEHTKSVQAGQCFDNELWDRSSFSETHLLIDLLHVSIRNARIARPPLPSASTTRLES